MGTPQFFEIPSTGTYRTTDGRASYFFIEGAMIPMYLAIALGLPGAGYDAMPVFNSAEQAAIVALINQHAPTGEDAGATYPIGQFFGDGSTYDSSTVYPATYDTLAVTADDAYALPFVVFRPTEFSLAIVRVTEGSAGNVRGALYSAYPNIPNSEYPATPGYPGALIATSSTSPATDSTGNKTMNFSAGTYLDPGLYYLAVQFSGTPTVHSIQSTAAGRYIRGLSASYSGVYDPNTSYGTLPDPFNNDNWGLYEDKMPRVTLGLKAQIT